MLAHRLNRGASLVDAKHSSSELLKLQSVLEAELSAEGMLAGRATDGWCVSNTTHPCHPHICAMCNLQSSHAHCCSLRTSSATIWYRVSLTLQFCRPAGTQLQHGRCLRRIVQVQLRRASNTGTPQLGLPHAVARTRRGSLAHVAYLDLVYSVTWPLNIIVTAEHLARYRKLLPVFLQVRSATHANCAARVGHCC